ncbi:MAG: vitamin B12-dependent ribonucleotide reductase [bacterium]|nr:vitamin B12-dependent ribonucleotide reductase [bacterium]
MKTKKILSLEDLKFPGYEWVRGKIDKKLGKRPGRPGDLPEGSWTEQAVKVLKERYLLKDDDLNPVETPEDMCWRVAWEAASAEVIWGRDKTEVRQKAKEFYKLLSSREFLPNSPTLMNAGTGNMLQYSACFVIPVEDSLIGIFDALKYQALIHQTGGGTGFSFSSLRSNGSMVKSSKGTASGPVSFMRIFDAATNEIKQGGKRRGANMGVLRVDHPDILEFINCKKDGGITNFNISVAITDKFMDAYKKNTDYDLINPKNNEKTGSLKAREVFAKISRGAWETGDPGLIFIDRLNNGVSNPVPSLGPIESTNPCGEVPLYPFDSCNLGSIFLNYFLKDDEGEKSVDWKKLKETTRQAIRFMDNIIEVNPYTLEQIRQTTMAVRRIGLGVGGWADMLIDLNIPYGSQDALDLAHKVMKTVEETAQEESENLAKERGAFPLWSQSIYKKSKARRNSTVTTIAPTGTTSIIAGASSGIEPLFAIAYRHIVKDEHLDRNMSFVNPKFEEIAKKEGFWSEEIKEKVAEKGVIKDIDGIPDKIKTIFATAHEIKPEWHVMMQSAFQKYTENAVSKTINLPHSSSIDDISKAFLLAWETNCKGITVFRDGSKDVQVLNLGLKDDGKPLVARQYKLSGATYKLATPLGTAFITINEDDRGEPLEIFINIGKAGSDVAAMAEALGRTISTTLRLKGDLSPKQRAKEIAHQLFGIGGRRWVGFGPNKIRSLPDAIGVALSSHYDWGINGKAEAVVVAKIDPAPASAHFPNGHSNGLLSNLPNDQANIIVEQETSDAQAIFGQIGKTGDICPSCGASVFVYEEGCSKCYACGHSEC